MMERVNQIMNHPRYIQLMEELCELEKNRRFCKHDIEHLLSVARIMLLSAYERSLTLDQESIYAAALLHDIGRVFQYTLGVSHEEAGCELAAVILKDCGYSEAEKSAICHAIRNHNQPEDSDHLGELLRYADKLSRNCFSCTATKDCNWSEEKKNKGVTL